MEGHFKPIAGPIDILDTISQSIYVVAALNEPRGVVDVEINK